MNSNNIVKLIISLFIPLLTGFIAGQFTASAVPEWYSLLNRPDFNPPSSVFGPVWTVLYALMGFSLYLVWKQKHSKERNQAITLFIIQLVLNFAWSFLFFWFQRIDLALVEIVVLWISVLFMIIQFFRVSKAAAAINIPYLLWVSFATLLNAAYYILN